MTAPPLQAVLVDPQARGGEVQQRGGHPEPSRPLDQAGEHVLDLDRQPVGQGSVPPCSRPLCSPMTIDAPGASWTMPPCPSILVTTRTEPPSTASRPNLALSRSRWAIPLRNGMTGVSGPTTPAISDTAASSPP